MEIKCEQMGGACSPPSAPQASPSPELGAASGWWGLRVFSGVTPPYWDNYNCHSYPIPDLNISIIKEAFPGD